MLVMDSSVRKKALTISILCLICKKLSANGYRLKYKAGKSKTTIMAGVVRV